MGLVETDQPIGVRPIYNACMQLQRRGAYPDWLEVTWCRYMRGGMADMHGKYWSQGTRLVSGDPVTAWHATQIFWPCHKKVPKSKFPFFHVEKDLDRHEPEMRPCM